jgi:hypothetical protein
MAGRRRLRTRGEQQPRGHSARHPFSSAALLVLLTLLAPSVAAGASEEDCRTFHEECEGARAAGYGDVGICNVERLECGDERSRDAAHGVGKTMPPPPATLPGGRSDPERSVGP